MHTGLLAGMHPTLSTMIRFFLLNPNKIFVSDYPIEKVHQKIGRKYEILNSIQDKESVDIIKQRLSRNYPQAIFEDYFVKIRKRSPETIEKIRQARLGKPRPDWVRQKISNAKKGVSQFQGKRHTEESKRLIAIKKFGNQHVKDTIWAHDPRGDEEQRVRDLKDMKEGFSKGRDYYSVEPGLYYFKLWAANRTRKVT